MDQSITESFTVKSGCDGFSANSSDLEDSELEFSSGVEKNVVAYTRDGLVSAMETKRYTRNQGSMVKQYAGGELVQYEYTSEGYTLRTKTLLFSLTWDSGLNTFVRKNEILKEDYNDPSRMDIFGNAALSFYNEYQIQDGKDGLSDEGRIDYSEGTLLGGNIKVKTRFINGGKAKESRTYKFVVDWEGTAATNARWGHSVFTGGSSINSLYEYNLDGNIGKQNAILSRTSWHLLTACRAASTSIADFSFFDM